MVTCASPRPLNGITLSDMPAPPHEFQFSYKGMPVGSFELESYPTAPGRYRYMPYRGPGHYELQTALRTGAQPHCTFQARGRAVSFVVVDCPEYGVLEVAEFDPEDVG